MTTMNPILKAYLDKLHAETRAQYDEIHKKFQLQEALFSKFDTGASVPQPAHSPVVASDGGLSIGPADAAVLPEASSPTTKAQEALEVIHDASPGYITMAPITCSMECSTQVDAITSVDEVQDAVTTVYPEHAVNPSVLRYSLHSAVDTFPTYAALLCNHTKDNLAYVSSGEELMFEELRWQPWPPPVQVQIRSKRSMSRPCPWPSFDCFHESAHLKYTRPKITYAMHHFAGALNPLTESSRCRPSVHLKLLCSSFSSNCRAVQLWPELPKVEFQSTAPGSTGPNLMRESWWYLQPKITYKISHMGHLFRPRPWPWFTYQMDAGYPDEPYSGIHNPTHDVSWSSAGLVLFSFRDKDCIPICCCELIPMEEPFICLLQCETSYAFYWEMLALAVELFRTCFIVIELELCTDLISYRINPGLHPLCMSTSRALVVLMCDWPLSSERELIAGAMAISTEKLLLPSGVQCEQPPSYSELGSTQAYMQLNEVCAAALYLFKDYLSMWSELPIVVHEQVRQWSWCFCIEKLWSTKYLACNSQEQGQFYEHHILECVGSILIPGKMQETIHIMTVSVQWKFLNQEEFRASGCFAIACSSEQCDHLWTFLPCLMVQPIYYCDLISMDEPFIYLPGTQLLPQVWAISKAMQLRREEALHWEQLTYKDLHCNDTISYGIKHELQPLCMSTSRALTALLSEWRLSFCREFLPGPIIIAISVPCTAIMCSAISIIFSSSWLMQLWFGLGISNWIECFPLLQLKLPWPSFSSTCRAVQVHWNFSEHHVLEQATVGCFPRPCKMPETMQISNMSVQWQLLNQEEFRGSGNFARECRSEATYKGVQFHSCYMVQQLEGQLQGHADHIMHGEINSNMWQSSGIQCVQPTNPVPAYMKLDKNRVEQRTSQNYKSLRSCSCFMVHFRDDSPLAALFDYNITSTCLMEQHMGLPPGGDIGYGDYRIITYYCPRFQTEKHEANCYSTTSPSFTLHTTEPRTDLHSQVLHEMSLWYLGFPGVQMHWRYVKLISAIERFVPAQPQNVSVITIAEVLNDVVHYSLGIPRESLCEEFLAGGATTTVSITALICKYQLQQQKDTCHAILMIGLYVTHNFYMASTGVQVALQEGRDVSLGQAARGRDYYLSHDRFSELVQVLLNYGYYHGSPGMITDLQASWDPGEFFATAAWGQAAFQEGRDVRGPLGLALRQYVGQAQLCTNQADGYKCLVIRRRGGHPEGSGKAWHQRLSSLSPFFYLQILYLN